MIRLGLIRVVIPKIIAYWGESGEPEYQCRCGMGVAKEYKNCPYCGAELAWKKVRRPSQELFSKLLDGCRNIREDMTI